MKKCLNIAHRGFSGFYPENTMKSFREAVEIGCDGIETDLHLTKDGILVICHDERIDRTTDGTGYICDYSLKELKKFDAGIRYGKGFKGEKIPTIDEFLTYIKDKDMLINFELKNNVLPYEGLELKVIEKIYEYNIEKKVILSSFNHYSMVKVKQIEKNIKTGLLYKDNIYNAHEYGKRLNADALHPYYEAVMNKAIVDAIKNQGLFIYTYTVDEEEDMKKLIELKIDGIITNYPDRLKRIMQNL